VLAAVDSSNLAPGLFVPVSELNHLRQRAVDELLRLTGEFDQNRSLDYRTRVGTAIARVEVKAPPAESTQPRLICEVFAIDDADAALGAGATDVVMDPFLRHPLPSLTRVRELHRRAVELGAGFRLRTPTIVRPQDRKPLDKWLDSGLPILTGHLGLLRELSRHGRDVAADYATNVFNQHSAAQLFALGASEIVLSVELTTEEIADVVAPWKGSGFVAVVFGRPEGMTIEHCVLSAAFDRVPTTCRDLCVQKHHNVELIDPAGYAFPVATDSDCRNRLLHSRPIDASAFVPRLWSAGLRRYKMIVNMPGEPVANLVAAYRDVIDAVASGSRLPARGPRELLNGEYTRGHYSRAV
jgi:putative protease